MQWEEDDIDEWADISHAFNRLLCRFNTAFPKECVEFWLLGEEGQTLLDAITTMLHTESVLVPPGELKKALQRWLDLIDCIWPPQGDSKLPILAGEEEATRWARKAKSLTRVFLDKL